MGRNRSFTPCLEGGCETYAVNNGRCLKHAKAWVGSTRKERLPKDWRARRLSVLQRDKYMCYVCGGEDADAVDHVIPGDDHRMSNLKAIHQDIPPFCHRYKSAAEGHASQGHRVPKDRRPF